MIRVTVEIVPFGFEKHTRHIGVMEIANDGTGTAEVGHYDARIVTDGVEKEYEVRGFLRIKNDVWDLIREVLEKRG